MFFACDGELSALFMIKNIITIMINKLYKITLLRSKSLYNSSFLCFSYTMESYRLCL